MILIINSQQQILQNFSNALKQKGPLRLAMPLLLQHRWRAEGGLL